MRIDLFNDYKPKNRRMNSKEMETELEICKIFMRPPRDFIFDKPTYPYIKPDYSKMVNFDLNTPNVCFDLNYPN